MRWPFSTAVSFETKLSAEELRQRLRENIVLPSMTGFRLESQMSYPGIPLGGKVGERFCELYTRTNNRSGGSRLLVLDLESLRMGKALQGVLRPSVGDALFPLALVVFGVVAGVNTESWFPIVVGLIISFLVAIEIAYMNRQLEPRLMAYVQALLQNPYATAGAVERFEITASDRPGRMRVQVGYHFFSKTDVVYGAFLNPNLARRFLFAAPNGMMVRAESTARVGGEFNFVDRREGVDVLHTGHYTALCWPTLIAFDFCVPMYSSASASVTLELEPTVPGCKVMLTCDGVLTEYAESTRDGWESMFSKAASVIDGATHDAA